MMSRASAVFWGMVALGFAGGPARSQDPVRFEQDVWPILQRSCVECHQTPASDGLGPVRRPKGGLRLDSKSGILAGSHSGKVIDSSQPEESLLYVVTTLDKSDDLFMPKGRTPLTSAERDALKKWVMAGADFGSWTGAGGEGNAAGNSDSGASPAVTPRVPDWHPLGAGLDPVPDRLRESVAGSLAQVVPAWPGSGLLTVTYFAHEAEVTDAKLQLLDPVSDRVADLRLRQTAITNKALATVARMKRLTRLDLSDTRITDTGLRVLSAATELRTLVLCDTDVTDQAVEALAALPHLEVVFLAGTDVTQPGVDRLRGLKPGLKVVHDPTLPAPPADPVAPARRRRG